MPKTRYRLPCPYCGSLDNKPMGITGLAGDGPLTALLRKYRCLACREVWESFEMANVPMPDTPPDWLGWAPEQEE